MRAIERTTQFKRDFKREMKGRHHAAVQNAFNVQRHLISRNTLRALRGEAFQNWRAATAA
jgi:putative transposase